MSISTDRCFVLVHTDGSEAENSDGTPHFSTAEHAADAADSYEMDDGPTPVPQQRAAPCFTVECGDCGYVADEAENTVMHFETWEGAREHARLEEWDIDGDRFRCPGCVMESEAETDG